MMNTMRQAIAVCALLAVSAMAQEVSPLAKVDTDADWYEPGVLFLADETNATDILVLTISVADNTQGTETIWKYRRLKKREKCTLHGGNLAINGCGPRGGSSLDISPSTTAITGTNIDFSIKYQASHDGVQSEGKAAIVVPVSGTSSGRVGKVTYKSEWRPNRLAGTN